MESFFVKNITKNIDFQCGNSYLYTVKQKARTMSRPVQV